MPPNKPTHTPNNAPDDMPDNTPANIAKKQILEKAKTLGWTLATAESCTGGLVAAALSELPGASAVFAGGFITYTNALKQTLLNVEDACLKKHGAVSAQTVAAMAENAQQKTGATLSVSVSGIAGPTGATPTKPLGLVHFATYKKGDAQAQCIEHIFSGDRNAVRAQATTFALSLLLKRLNKG